MLVGCVGNWWGMRVAIDGKSTIAMPSEVTRWLQAAAPIRVNPGDHRIRISPTRWDTSFEAEAQFSCAAGESVYVVIDFSSSDASVAGKIRLKLPATVTISREMPEALREQGMLIYADRTWLVEQEP